MATDDMPDDGPEYWQLTFRREGDGPPVAVRVRRLLKAALRAYGLRCVGVADGTPKDAGTKQSDRAPD